MKIWQIEQVELENERSVSVKLELGVEKLKNEHTYERSSNVSSVYWHSGNKTLKLQPQGDIIN